MRSRDLIQVFGIRGLFGLLLAAAVTSQAQVVELGEAPIWLEGEEPAAAGSSRRSAGLSVDRFDREAVRQFYHNVYLGTEGVEAGWTGDVLTCDPGDLRGEYIDATLLRLNYFRAMAGLPGDVALDLEVEDECMAAALMMIAQGELSHCNSHDPCTTFLCYRTEAAWAASRSNLVIGESGPRGIDTMIRNSGPGNYYVGHRRWLLFPRQVQVGIGATTAINGPYYGSLVVHVINDWGERPEGLHTTMWPPEGYVPYQIVYPRWSLSREDGDFTRASVRMWTGAVPVALEVNRQLQDIGTDNTIVWEPLDLPIKVDPFDDRYKPPKEDVTYRVELLNVIVDGERIDYEYQVTLFNPDVALPTPTPTPTPSPSPTPTPIPAPDDIAAQIRDASTASEDLDINADQVLDAGDVIWAVRSR